MLTLEEQKAELQKTKAGRKLLKDTKKAATGSNKAPRRSASKPLTSNKGAKNMTQREKDEKVAITIAKTAKLESFRINPKGDSKSGVGPLKVNDKSGKLLIAVRSNDVVIYRPQDKVGGYGRVVKGYPHITVFKHGDTNLEAAIKKAVKVAKDKDAWGKEMGYSTRQTTGKAQKPDTMAVIKSKKKDLEKELTMLRKQEKAIGKKKSTKKATSKKSKALAKVAEAIS